MKNNPQFIEAVKVLLERSLSFKVKVNFDQLKEVLTSFVPYNFIPENIKEIGDEVKKVILPQDYGKDNPNTGGYDHVTFHIGNEHSLVFYVNVNVKACKMDISDVKKKLERIGKKFHADEISFEESETNTNYFHLIEMRLWWD